MPTAVVGSFWDASAREVAGAMTSIGVQACGHCGLSLSASARFCRRCGTRQARSA
jgi:ribosomal protein L40E